MRRILVLVLLALTGWWIYSISRPVRLAPGVLVKSEPVQSAITIEQADPWAHGAYRLRALAQFDITGRLLSRKFYSSDEISDLTPIDFAVGWGPMSDQAVLDRITVWQTGRFFFWKYQNPPPISKEAITAHATNMHLIPSTAEVAVKLKKVRTGDLFRLRGLLVEATKPGLNPVRSSLTRTDTGKGACEVVWVESVELLK
jgi:hypothetical protein